MAQITLSRSETIPFTDSSGAVIQMKNFEISASVTSEEGDTEESVKQLLEDLFNGQREIVGKTSPLLQSKDKRIRMLQDELKKRTSSDEYASIIYNIKQI